MNKEEKIGERKFEQWAQQKDKVKKLSYKNSKTVELRKLQLQEKQCP